MLTLLSLCPDCVSLAYQRVQKVECTSPRPVLILGPLTDPVKEMLVKESPGKFCRCVLGEFSSSRVLLQEKKRTESISKSLKGPALRISSIFP